MNITAIIKKGIQQGLHKLRAKSTPGFETKILYAGELVSKWSIVSTRFIQSPYQEFGSLPPHILRIGLGTVVKAERTFKPKLVLDQNGVQFDGSRNPSIQTLVFQFPQEAFGFYQQVKVIVHSNFLLNDRGNLYGEVEVEATLPSPGFEGKHYHSLDSVIQNLLQVSPWIDKKTTTIKKLLCNIDMPIPSGGALILNIDLRQEERTAGFDVGAFLIYLPSPWINLRK